MIKSFVLGAVAGGVAVWVWRDEIAEYIDERTRAVRGTIVDVLDGFGDALESFRQRLDSGLAGAESGASSMTRPARGAE